MPKTRLNRNDKEFKQRIICRSTGLLEMFYFPKEIAAELGVTDQTVKYWLRDGLPYEITPDGEMIIGTVACNWILKTYKKNHKATKSDPSQGYCLKCQKTVTIKNATNEFCKGTVLKKGYCPICNGKINRGIKKENWFE